MKKKESPSFKFFKSRVLYYFDFYGMKDWEVCVNSTIEDVEFRATYDYDIRGKVVTITLATNSIKESAEITGSTIQEELDKTAFHEVTEIMFILIREWALQPHGSSYDEVDREIHTIVRRFENVLWPRIKKK